MTAASAHRVVSSALVAQRFLAAKEWGDPSRILAEYRRALTDFRQNVEEQRNRPDGGKPNNLLLAYKMTPMVKSGRELVDWILQTRSIPPGDAKPMEMAGRTLGSIRKSPPDIITWSDKNSARLDFLLEAATWPDRSEAGGQVSQVGPFHVHNTVGADAKQFANVEKLVEQAVKDIRQTRDFSKVLYGDVYIVGQVQHARAAAWYSVKDDDLYVRMLAKRGEDDLQNVIHELGHRYWVRFATPSQKKAVGALYTRLSYGGGGPVEPPKVGDRLPFAVKGVPADATITQYDGLRYHLSSGGFLKADSVWKIMRQEEQLKSFPSRYSAKDRDEFFAECFSFYVLGQLKPELREKFEEALNA